MSVAEHVQRWQENLGVPGQPPLEINPYLYVGAHPLRWIDQNGFEAESPNAANPILLDSRVEEPGLESPCVECVIVPLVRAGKIVKTHRHS